MYIVLLWVYASSAERARPYLLTTDAYASTDYINAVYIDVRTSILAIRYLLLIEKLIHACMNYNVIGELMFSVKLFKSLGLCVFF